MRNKFERFSFEKPSPFQEQKEESQEAEQEKQEKPKAELFRSRKWMAYPLFLPTYITRAERGEDKPEPADFKDLQAHKGEYAINNGVIACVGKGEGEDYVFIAWDEPGLVEELEEAGYKRSNFRVPFSNREKPYDPVKRAQWESLEMEVKALEREKGL